MQQCVMKNSPPNLLGNMLIKIILLSEVDFTAVESFHAVSSWGLLPSVRKFVIHEAGMKRETTGMMRLS